MGIWRINKKGISLNENGRYITFCFVRLFPNDNRGQWLLRFFIKLPFMEYAWIFQAFVGTRKRYFMNSNFKNE